METMSVSELIKTAVPLNSAQSDAANILCGSATLVKSVSSASIPIRSRNSVAPPTGTSCPTSSNENIVQKGKVLPKSQDEFFKDLQQFHEKRGTPCTHLPKISGKTIDLHKLYNEVIERGGFAKVNNRDEWDEILPELGFKDKCVNASAAVKHFYRRFLDKYERLNFFGEDPDKVDAADVSDTNDGGRLRRFFTSTLGGGGGTVNAVPMSYNYRQHIVNMDRRRMYKLSMDLYKPSPYEKLMLSLISPLPNEQDFAINVCTLMANESKHTLKINEYPKLLDVLLAHTGVFSDYSLRELFQYVYKEVRHNSLLGFWYDLLYNKPQILQLYSSDSVSRDPLSASNTKQESALDECLDMDFLNLGRGKGTQDYVGQRVQQIIAILRNLSFFDENLEVFAKNRTFLRFIVMCTNIRWGSIHNQALDIAGNVATEMELLDPTSDELSRSLMATLCDGIEGRDRAVIINSLEIMYKLCQRDSNGEHIFKCLGLKFYKTICMFLSLNDIMLLIYTLEAIYALSSMGARFCHLIMQVRGIIDQLVSLITVEAQSYGPDGCILMRVVETVPGNMLPMVAQNIANLQNVSVVQPKHTNATPQQLHEQQPQQQLVTNVDTSHSVPPQQSSPAQNNGTASHEDEQYALSWLGATFDRASTVDSRVEQQELYRMYLSHCQKSGKHSVVTHTQFPRLVRLIFSTGVGPIAVKHSDGTELPGLYYVAIRLRAQPLPIQTKVNQTSSKNIDVGCSARKIKPKRQKVQSEQQHPQVNTTVAKQDITEYPNTPIVKTNNQLHIQEIPTATSVTLSVPQTTKCVPTDTATNAPQNKPVMGAPPEKTTSSVDDNLTSLASSESLPVTIQSTTFQPIGSCTTNTQPSSSLIKSLLANKVTQRQQKQKELVATATAAGAQPSPIKVASTSISALVNNPLMQNTPLKVGQTTIKPLNTPTNMDKKLAIESTPPPLAPLSCGNSATVQSDNSGRPVIIANQMLVDILDKKASDPVNTSSAIKRKLDEASAMAGRDTAKRLAMETVKINETQITPSKNAANLYAEMAASILEDEDLEDIPPPITTTIKPPEQQQQSVVIPTGVSLQNVQRQLLFQASQSPHLKLTQQSQQHIPTAMATIKTDQGLQTVPVILQQKPIEQQQPQLIQQVIQTNVPVSLPQPQQQTQYVLATNPQGQTYLVAQQSQAPTPPPQPTQTVLVTQTPQQQSAGTKTIIILQQQTVPSQSQQQIGSPSAGGGQKMIMTTAQGQQVLVTQRQAATITSQPQQQFFINAQTGTATHIQHVPVSTVCSVPVSSNMQQTNTNMLQRQLIQQSNICNNSQTQSGQISPSLLSQLNHIPATIKLHNPNMQITGPSMQSHCQQQLSTAALSRLGKSVSIVQTAPALTAATPLQIPQLQQHQSIIQQHIISGPSEKRQVIVGGRAVEIKETVITQTQQPPPQQQQLNSQTIITTQPTLQQQKLVQQQQPQSIIQQKISVSMPQQQQVSKTNDPVPSLIQSCVKFMPPAQQAAQITIQPPLQATSTTTKKPQNATYSKQSQSNIPVQNVGSSTIKPIINSRPTTPVSIVTSTEITPTTSVGFFSQQDTFRSSAETKSTDVSYSAPIKPTTSGFTASTTITATPPPQLSVQSTIDPHWLYICDWRNCPRRKFKSIQDLHHHACMAHCPDHLEPGAEIFCQWGSGPGLCDGIPRKRFSLMTHILDRHLTIENLRAAAQRRIQTGVNHTSQPSQSPVTIIRNIEATQRGNTASPALSTSSSGSLPSTGSSAIHAIKRHTADFINPKELMDENEGPVTKSIRLTASLVLRNLVTYTTNAKRSLRRHEAHLANVALSNVESSATISHILFELNN